MPGAMPGSMVGPWLLLVGAACGPPGRAEPWPGQRHVTAGTVDAGPPPTLTRAREVRSPDDVDGLAWDELVAVWRDLRPGAAPAARVALRLALGHRHRGEDDAALAWAKRVRGDADAELRADAVQREIAARREVDRGVLAVLLPLSGPFAAVGREIEAGIAAATVGAGVRLVLLDTAGDAEAAVRAVDRAVYEAHALAILGPVGVRESRAAAARAVELGMPIALLAPAEDGAAPEAGVFRLWSSGEDLARAAARAAVARGFSALAVLAPRDEHGRAQGHAFASEAAALGVRVVAAGDYDPTGTDLEPDLRRFLGFDPATNERFRRHLSRDPDHGAKTFSPDVAFDLLYIPDEYTRAALVASYLPFFNVELRTGRDESPDELRRRHGGRLPARVQLLGSPGWHHPGLLARGGPAVEGALLVDVCVGGATEDYASPGGAAFAAEFAARAGRPPSTAAAQARDAAALDLAAQRAVMRSKSAAKTVGVAARRSFSAKLAAARLADGACGSASIDAGGQARRGGRVVLRVEDGDLIVDSVGDGAW
jgi:ABC-type branched-subunit amino acid transport system substrate-binding protein